LDGYKLHEPGLQGEVRKTKSGGVTIRFRAPYKWAGKLAWFSCGTFPHAPLEEIRREAAWCREQVEKGVNPQDKREADRLQAQADIRAVLAEEEARKSRDKPVASMVADWLSRGVRRADDNTELQRILGKDVLPTLSDIPTRLVSEEMLAARVRAVADRDSPRMAVVVFRILTQLYTWANKREPWRTLLREGQGGNPMELVELKPLLPKNYDIHNIRDRVLSEREISTLSHAMRQTREAYEAAPNKRTATQPLENATAASVWICLSTLCRIGELSKARWENVNLDERMWFVPKEDTKEKQSDLKVHLSTFALRVFSHLAARRTTSPWVFPSINDPTVHRDPRTVAKQLKDRQGGSGLPGRVSNSTLALEGGSWTPHDLRRTGATLMQRLGVSLDIIDRCQNHVLAGSKVRRHYLHYAYEAECREAWNRLGDHLDTLTTPRLGMAA
jgi:integrase